MNANAKQRAKSEAILLAELIEGLQAEGLRNISIQQKAGKYLIDATIPYHESLTGHCWITKIVLQDIVDRKLLYVDCAEIITKQIMAKAQSQ